ncbi:hypothetical protein DL767_009792 [Monosporascus sp. MG133]|nr:hypothetical protein DL767_009792 [Monosporascus sp. MG133]
MRQIQVSIHDCDTANSANRPRTAVSISILLLETKANTADSAHAFRPQTEQLQSSLSAFHVAQQIPPPWPFATEVLANANGTMDTLPAAYQYYERLGKKKKHRIVANPAKGLPDFLDRELSSET